MLRAARFTRDLISTILLPQTRRARRRISLLLLFGLASALVVATLQSKARACDFCLGESPLGPPGPNTYWSLVDNLSACPAGDSVAAGHPSRLRMEVWYDDANCAGKVGVPPESLWVTYSTVAGNLLVNDKGINVYADDSTDACGHTWITIPSFSGCGTLRATLYVAGVSQGYKDVTIRTTDSNADGRTDGSDTSPCDINYDGQANSADLALAIPHPNHWRRQALHGVLVRRTNLRNFGPIGADCLGSGPSSWSPSGRWIVIDVRDSCDLCTFEKKPCRIKYVSSDPARGNTVRNLTFNGTGPGQPKDSMDYAGSWSPQGGTVFYIRADLIIHRKGVPGFNPDTSDIAVIAAVAGGGMDDAQISPNGDTLAYVEANFSPPHVIIAPATGGSRRDLTPGTTFNWRYPQWSPDGSYLTVTREDPTTFRRGLYKIRVRGDPTPTPFLAADTVDAAWSSVSSDGGVVVAGSARNPTDNHTVHTMDGSVDNTTARAAVEHYPSYTTNIIFPHVSPDGTRLLMDARDPAVPTSTTLGQVWAARLNMNLPPRFASVTSSGEGTRAVADSATSMDFTFSCKPHTLNTITLSATDPEGNSLTYLADFLGPSMTWNPATRTLSYLAGFGVCPNGRTYHVLFRVTTASGGTDALIGSITFPLTLAQSGAPPLHAVAAADSEAEGPNPTRASFAVPTPFITGTTAELVVYDLSGRRVAVVLGAAGRRLIWNGQTSAGAVAPNGVYLYRLTVGDYRRTGRVVLVR